MTPAKVVSVKMWIDFKLYFIRLRNNNSCRRLSIYDFPGTMPINFVYITVFTMGLQYYGALL